MGSEKNYINDNKEDQLIIRQKIVLNIAYKLNHVLLREMNYDMKKNFLIKSHFKHKKKMREM